MKKDIVNIIILELAINENRFNVYRLIWSFGWESLTVASGEKVFKTLIEANRFIMEC